MDNVLRDIDFVTTYIDDVLVAFKDHAEHLQHLRQLFQRLQSYEIKIHPAKCVLGVDSVDFLSHKVTADGLRPLPQKVSAIQDFPRPTTARKLREFLGIVNYYHRFIPGAADILRPLNGMLTGLQKGSQKTLVWTSEGVESFTAIKSKIATITLLAHQSPYASTVLTTDASATAVGAVLQQRISGSLMPLAFFSRRLEPRERRYSTFHRELLAVYLAVRHFRHFLEGRQFQIWTDHKPLVYALTRKSDHHSPRVVRQLSYIAEITSDIRHISGHENIPADALSRNVASIIPENPAPDYEEIAACQRTDEGLQNARQGTSLLLQAFRLQASSLSLWCDVSCGHPRPFIPASYRKSVFLFFHILGPPGTNATARTRWCGLGSGETLGNGRDSVWYAKLQRFVDTPSPLMKIFHCLKKGFRQSMLT